MLFAAPLKSKGFPGRTFSSKNSRGPGTTSELSIDPDGGWWDPKGCKCPGGCWDSRGDKKQTESKPISSRMFLQNTRKSTWTWTSLKWNNFGIRHNLRMFYRLWDSWPSKIDEQSIDQRLTSCSKQGRSCIATRALTFVFSIDHRIVNRLFYFSFHNFRVLLNIGFGRLPCAKAESDL